MNTLIILIILCFITIACLYSFRPSLKESYTNPLEIKYYYDKQDCILNGNCIIKPNNINFFQYPKTVKSNITKLKCNFGCQKFNNCTADLRKGCFKNKTCGDNVENFVNVTNTPGINSGGNFPRCPQGFKPRSDGKCVQFCRGCTTGICKDGICNGI